jgi:hypothetical protein
MDQTAKTFTSEEAGVARWIGRIIVAVILGEAIWNLIVSVINYVVVPWLGDLLGRSWNLPASFTQRPYNYLDLSVSVLELGVAGIVAVVLNYLFERRRAQKVKPSKSSSLQGSPRSAPIEVAKVAPQPVGVGAQAQISSVALPVPPAKRDPVAPPLAVAQVAAAPAPLAAPPAVASSALPAVSTPAGGSAPPKPPLPASPDKAIDKAPKPKKPKAVYYNIVGEPMPSDED